MICELCEEPNGEHYDTCPVTYKARIAELEAELAAAKAKLDTLETAIISWKHEEQLWKDTRELLEAENKRLREGLEKIASRETDEGYVMGSVEMADIARAALKKPKS